jgi:hypothetical protein
MNQIDPLADFIWHAADLARAYLAQDRAHAAARLMGLDTSRLELVLAWLVLDHDAHFDELGEPSMSVRELDEEAALAPVETELAMMTALRRIGAKELRLTRAVEGPALSDRVHAVAICTVVMLLEAFGRIAALDRVADAAARYERMGYPRPCTIT